MSNIERYGFHAPTTFSGASTPTGMMFSTSSASPSVITSSGSNVALASRPPIIGSVPIGLARISPSSRKHSASATAQTSARVGATDPRAHAATACLVLGLGHVDVAGAEVVPGVVALGAGGVLLLERFVARVVGDALGEVRAVRRLDHAVGHQAVDPQRLRRALLQEVVGVDDALDRHEAALARPCT